MNNEVADRILEYAADYYEGAEPSLESSSAEVEQVKADYKIAEKWLLKRYEECQSAALSDTMGTVFGKLQPGTPSQTLEASSLIAHQWFAQHNKMPTLPDRFFNMIQGKRVGVAIGLGGDDHLQWQFKVDCDLDVIVHFAGDGTEPAEDGFGTLFQKQSKGPFFEGSIVCNDRDIPVWEVYKNFVPCNDASSDFLALLAARGAKEVEILCGVDGYYCEKLANLAQTKELPFFFMHGSKSDHILEYAKPGEVRNFYRDRTIV